MITKQVDLESLNTINFNFQHPGYSYYRMDDENRIEVYVTDPAKTDILTEAYTCENFKIYTENKDNYLIIPVTDFHCKFRTNEAYFQIEGSQLESLNSGLIKVEYTLTYEGFSFNYTVPTDSFVPYTVKEETDINARNISKLREDVDALKATAGSVDLTDVNLAINNVERQILEMKQANNTVINNQPTVLTQEQYDQLGKYENKLYLIIEND